MLEELRKQVYEANMALKKSGLVLLTWGNASAFCKEEGLLVIKPSGVSYDELAPDNMVVLDLEGNVVEGDLKPSSDTATHIELYKAFPEIGGVVHTHSTYATSWAQSGRSIPCYGTTHADYFYGSVLCARELTVHEIKEAYEKNTGLVIVDELKKSGKEVFASPAILCRNHGPFTWGRNVAKAVENAIVLEEIAKMAYQTEELSGKGRETQKASSYLMDKHYYRKHGENAYYGQ